MSSGGGRKSEYPEKINVGMRRTQLQMKRHVANLVIQKHEHIYMYRSKCKC